MKNVKRLFIMELCDSFLIFKDFLRIFVMFLKVDMCDIVILSLLQVKVVRLRVLYNHFY